MTREPQVGDVYGYDYEWEMQSDGNRTKVIEPVLYISALSSVCFKMKPIWKDIEYKTERERIDSWFRDYKEYQFSIHYGNWKYRIYPNNSHWGVHKLYYLWKLAPRYKRLFWTYFIPDKNHG